MKKAPLVLSRGNDQPAIVLRIGQLWMIGKTDKGRRVYSIIDLRRTPDRAVRLWDGFGSAERAEWVPVHELVNYTQVGRQGNLGEVPR